MDESLCGGDSRAALAGLPAMVEDCPEMHCAGFFLAMPGAWIFAA